MAREAAAAEPAAKRPRLDEEAVVCFGIQGHDSTFTVALRVLEQHPDGLLYKLAHSSMGGTRNGSGAIILGPPMSEATLRLALDEYELCHSFNLDHVALRRPTWHYAGPPLRCAINPIELHAAWDYLGLPSWMVRSDRIRPGSRLGVLVAQKAMDDELHLSYKLRHLVQALSCLTMWGRRTNISLTTRRTSRE